MAYLKRNVINDAADLYKGVQRMQDSESIPLVDICDRIIGFKQKYAAHTLNHLGKCSLHRAFSVFLFDETNRLLLQRRSSYKNTFPLYLTNSCCSHPNSEKEELNEEKGLGIKLAAIRRLTFELGIKEMISPDELKLVTRMRYCAKYNEVLGENEIDYCFIIRKAVTLDPNPAEVDSIVYVEQQDFSNLISANSLTPWFKFICPNMLMSWWKNLDTIIARQDEKIPPIIDVGDISDNS